MKLYKMRVRFKGNGAQRGFLKKIIEKCGAPSLKELAKRIDVNYSTLKNYFSEDRLLPQNLFENLRLVFGIEGEVKLEDDNWGQVLGGKKGRVF